MNLKLKKGFTLVEVMASVTLLVMAMGLALSGYMFSLKNVNQADVQNELDMDVQLTMERLKKDLRLSSLDAMFYFPSGAGPYKALSFPLAEDSDGDGILETDAIGKILWDETVIYHIRPTTPNQLVKTTFKPRDNSLSDAQRQAQLESVVKYGHGSSTYNSQNATSKMIFENLLEWEINPKSGRFDAYSPALTRDSSSLGYILLDPGEHKFTFKVIDKNRNSGGYKIGLDQLFVSPSYSEREAEAQLPATAQSGATAISRYMPVGSWKGNHHLVFPATSVGNSFTLTLNNDQWEETNFGALGYAAEDTEFIFDETLTPKDNIVQLRGNDITWEASEQTGSLIGTSISNTTLKGTTVAVHINGAELLTNGNWTVYNGKKCKLTFQANATGRLQVKNVYIGKTTSTEKTVFSLDGAPKNARFSGSSESGIMMAGATETSDWIDFEINTTNNYIVVFKIKDDSDKCFPMAWENQYSPNDCVVAGNPTNHIIGLKSITASYPESGTYTSQIFDTHLSKPRYGDLSWNAQSPPGTALSFKVRTGSNPDLSDATNWESTSASSVNPRSVGASYKRYIQFQTLLQSNPGADYTTTPKLKDITIDWGGERQLVDIGGIFTKGPDYGMFEIQVDGNPLRSALIVDLEIYDEILTMDHESLKVTSSLKIELTPRNSGK